MFNAFDVKSVSVKQAFIQLINNNSNNDNDSRIGIVIPYNTH